TNPDETSADEEDAANGGGDADGGSPAEAPGKHGGVDHERFGTEKPGRSSGAAVCASEFGRDKVKPGVEVSRGGAGAVPSRAAVCVSLVPAAATVAASAAASIGSSNDR
ncbi:hypothetical protein KEM52_006737, partial [Ascosphaera acerosa]